MGVAGTSMPDLEHAGCILFWGYNPSLARLAHATATVAALKRGARLIVVDPRRVGLASKADLWLRVRPGTDGALALGIAHVMIERGWYDRDFVRDWTNGPLLVRADNGRLLTERDLSPTGSARQVRRLGRRRRGVRSLYDPARRRYERDGAEPALFGEYDDRARRRGDGRLPARLRALPPSSAGATRPRRSRRSAGVAPRPGRGGRPAALGGAAGRLLRLERRRAAEQRHPDRPRHRASSTP